MEEFTKVYTHLYEALDKFNVKLEIEPKDMDMNKIQMLYPIFRLIDAQVERETVDDHIFLFAPLIKEQNFFGLTENNRKILLVYVKKLYEIQSKMNLEEPDLGAKVSDMLSLFDTTDLQATDDDIKQATETLGETMGLDEDDPMRLVMKDIIHTVGNGLKTGKSIQDLIKEATQNFRGRITHDLKSGNITPQQIEESQKKMMEKVEKLLRNPLAAASMMKSPETKKKEKAERRKALRKKWRGK